MKLAILDDYEQAALDLADWDRLDPDIKIDVYHDHLGPGEKLIARLLPYDILVVMRERTPFPGRLIERLPNLKLIVTSGARNLAIDTRACFERNIVVSGTDSSKAAPAELTWGFILAMTRQLYRMDAALRKGRWKNPLGSGLEGKVLGVLGLGHIGTRVARVGAAFGMHVIAWSQHMTADQAAAAGAVYQDRQAFFSTADIISVHLVLSERTRGLVGANELALMKPSAYIVNTSRGPIIDEKALVAALKNGRIAGAGLDVFETEPLPAEHPLATLENTLLTPHIGYVIRENFQTYFTQAVEDVAAWRAGKPIRVLAP